jgi:hypothetical protein
MRKLLLVGAVVAAPVLFASSSAFAWGCGYGYGYGYAPRYYGYRLCAALLRLQLLCTSPLLWSAGVRMAWRMGWPQVWMGRLAQLVAGPSEAPHDAPPSGSAWIEANDVGVVVLRRPTSAFALATSVGAVLHFAGDAPSGTGR